MQAAAKADFHLSRRRTFLTMFVSFATKRLLYSVMRDAQNEFEALSSLLIPRKGRIVLNRGRVYARMRDARAVGRELVLAAGIKYVEDHQFGIGEKPLLGFGTGSFSGPNQ